MQSESQAPLTMDARWDIHLIWQMLQWPPVEVRGAFHPDDAPAPHNPVIHLRHVAGGQLFDHYLDSFDRIWEHANPYIPASTMKS